MGCAEDWNSIIFDWEDSDGEVIENKILIDQLVGVFKISIKGLKQINFILKLDVHNIVKI